jgi:hypothetical protein
MSAQRPADDLERRLREAALALPYPPTPDLRPAARRRKSAHRPRLYLRLALALIAALLGLLAVPQVRAAMLRVLQIGSVRIILEQPSPLPTAPLTSPAPTAPPTATPITALRDLAGATTLEEARRELSFPIRLPSYPDGIGPPDQLYRQQIRNGTMLILVWLDPQSPDGIMMSLHILTSSLPLEKEFLLKTDVRVLEEASVDGRWALWVEGPHFVQVQGTSGSEAQLRRLVDGNVLLWADGELTYRLESHMSLEQAVSVAESLR